MMPMYSPYVCVRIVYDNLTKKDLYTFEKRLKIGRIVNVAIEGHYHWYNPTSLIVEYPSYKKAVAAAHRYSKNPRITLVEVATSTIRIK
jgi:hypothetical protein